MVTAVFSRRGAAGQALIGQRDRMAYACRDMAAHFHRGSKLIVFGRGENVIDPQNIAVDFVHPIEPGRLALPAITLSNDAAALTSIARTDGFDEVFAVQLRLLGRSGDIALGISDDGWCRNVVRALEQAHTDRLLTVALVGGEGGMVARSRAVDHLLTVPGLAEEELYGAACAILWELVHLFIDHPEPVRPPAAP